MASLPLAVVEVPIVVENVERNVVEEDHRVDEEHEAVDHPVEEEKVETVLSIAKVDQ